MADLVKKPFFDNRYSEKILYGFILFFLLFKIIKTLLDLQPTGDESFFINELLRFRSDGLYVAFSEGISHLYILLAAYFDMVICNPLLSLRIVSLIQIPVFLLVVYKISCITFESKECVHLSLFTAMSIVIGSRAGTMFFRGINDSLMVTLAFICTFFLLIYTESRKVKYIIYSSIFCGLMFWVRQFSILIAVGFITFIIVLIIQSLITKRTIKNTARSALIFLMIGVVVAIIPQIPSLKENNRISFETKSGRLGVSWEQRNWLTAKFRYNNNSLFAYRSASWEEASDYIEMHRDDSIPNGLIERLKADPKIVIDSFISSMFFRVPYILFVSIGILFFLFLDFLRNAEKNIREKLHFKSLFLLLFLSVTTGVCLTVINYVEHRWLFVSVVCGLLLALSQLETYRARYVYNIIINIQVLFVVVSVSYGLFRGLF